MPVKPETMLIEKLKAWIDPGVLAETIVEVLSDYKEMGHSPELEKENLQVAKEIYLSLLETIPGEIRNIIKYRRKLIENSS